MMKKLTLALLSVFLVGCFPFSFNEEKDELKDKDELTFKDVHIKYYADKTLTSLEIPPDLTKPSTQNAFKLSEFVSNVHEDVISFSKKDKRVKKTLKILATPSDIEVKRFGDRRWLVVSKTPEKVWNLSESFFKSHGFVIKTSNKKIGIMETDFLENKADIPDEAVGMIRAMLKKATSASYALPTIDKYRLRIEPIEKGVKTEVYLTLTSMAEVLYKENDDGDNTIWQSREKDKDLEIKMLYELMLALGSNEAAAREKLTRAKEEKKLSVEISEGIGGYAKLLVKLRCRSGSSKSGHANECALAADPLIPTHADCSFNRNTWSRAKNFVLISIILFS
jgi:outer membrane protein assembly factor BamC